MSEWVIVAVVGVILLFSAKKLPDMARGLGQSMRIFKAETRGMREDDADHTARADRSGRTEPPAVAPGRAAGDPTPGSSAGGAGTTSEPRGGSTPS